jgi:uncharacterized protein (TIGR02145 family)
MKTTKLFLYLLLASALVLTNCGEDQDDPTTCSDGIQNGTETGVDCGGASCPACPVTPTCSDGIQNGTEAGVDCGGAVCIPCSVICPLTVIDIDGNVYDVVKIGNQCWMKENLKTSKYNDGANIPTGLSDAMWQSTTSGAYAIYDNNVDLNNFYGKLYNWYAVNTGKLCPVGWHIPSDAEWTILTDFLGGEEVAGGKMKSTTGWQAPNTGATNSSGFTGLPGGYRTQDDGGIYDIGYGGFWWSSTEYVTSSAWSQYLHWNFNYSYRYNTYRADGLSCRCIKD